VELLHLAHMNTDISFSLLCNYTLFYALVNPLEINICIEKRRSPMTLRNLSLNLELGQEILVGKNDERAKITKIEYCLCVVVLSS